MSGVPSLELAREERFLLAALVRNDNEKRKSGGRQAKGERGAVAKAAFGGYIPDLSDLPDETARRESISWRKKLRPPRFKPRFKR
jgi:hypothetical protein